MDIQRKGSLFEMDLDKPEDALGLYAVLNNKPELVPPEVFAKGQQIYAWFFQELGQLAASHEKEANLYMKRKKPGEVAVAASKKRGRRPKE